MNLGDFEATSKKQLVASSVVYLEDYIKIYSGWIFKTWTTYYCKLMGTCLICRKNKKDTRPSMIIYLSKTSIWQVKDDTNHPYSFMIYHPERETVLLSVETEDKMNLWINSLKEIKENLKKFDKSDVEDYTSSDDDQNDSYTCFGIKWKKIFNRKHKYQHIIENADFLHENNKNEKEKLKDGKEGKQNFVKYEVEVNLDEKEKFLNLCKEMNLNIK